MTYWAAAAAPILLNIVLITALLIAIALAYVDTAVRIDREVEVDVRGKRLQAQVVSCHGRSEAPPYFRTLLARYNIGMLFLLSTGEDKDLEVVRNWARKAPALSTGRRHSKSRHTYAWVLLPAILL